MPPAWPIADPALAQEILDLVQQAQHYRQLKKGFAQCFPTTFWVGLTMFGL